MEVKNDELRVKSEGAMWQERLVAAMDALMERDLKPCELRAVWAILMCSVGLGRETTARITLRDLAAKASLTTASVCRALKGLRAKRIIRKNGDGWQFLPESKFHIWLVPWRLDEEKRLTAKRVNEAQGVKVRGQEPGGGCQQSAISDQPEAKKNENLKSEIGDWKAAENESEEQQMKGTTNMKDQDTDNHGIHETHGSGGGNGVFLPPDIANVAKSAPESPSKSLSPPDTGLLTNSNTLKGEPLVDSGTNAGNMSFHSNDAEAGKAEDECDVDIEDGHTTKEAVLLKRLERLVGKEGPDGMKKWGGAWRNLVRVCATAVRDAINDTVVADREGAIKTTRGRYCWNRAKELAGWQGWVYDQKIRKWVQHGESVNIHQHRNASGGRA